VFRSGTDKSRGRAHGRGARVAAGLSLATLALTACSGGDAGRDPAGSTGGAQQEDVELRFAWWGGDVRRDLTQQVIERYEAANPHVTITGEFSDWAGYWDRLATTVASGDAPDVMQMDFSYLSQYAGRGALLEIPDTVDTSTMSPEVVATGQTKDGLFAVPNGINAYAIIANPAVFEAAGVPMPDDTTWTWEDYAEIAQQITEKSGGSAHGSALGFPTTLDIVARQNGEDIFTTDGGLGVSEESVTEHWDRVLRWTREGVIPEPSAVAENMNVGVEQTHFAAGQGAMTFDWSNLLKANMDAAGSQDLELLRLPSATGRAQDNGSFLKPAQYWAISAGTEHPEEAADFVDYLLNSEEAARILLAERGAPPNDELRALISKDLDPADAQSLAFIDEITDEVGDAPPAIPVGGEVIGEVYYRYATEVVFERMTPADAARGFLDELGAAIGD
jgi:multiple sugar transport system substrate-binding protein